MKKAKKFITVMLLFTLIFTGCSGISSQDTYVEETDYPYQYAGKTRYTIDMVRGKDAMYFPIGHYIYRLDEGTETLAPLCNKPNCLHDKETDPDRMEECNAYIPENTDGTGITYMKGYLYSVMKEEGEDGECNVLYKIAGDGSTREKVYQWDGSVVEDWCIHRNTLYYAEHIFDENNQEHYDIKSMALSGFGKWKSKTIYEPDAEVSVMTVAYIRAYGNHLYFNIDGAKTNNFDVDQISDEDWIKYNYNKMFQYNLKSKTLSEIQVPEQTDTQMVSQLTFWQDKIIYHAFDLDKNHQYDVMADVYIADLDGSNVEVLLRDIPMYRYFSSDGTYLYISDCSECLDKIYHDADYWDNEEDPDYKYDFEEHVDVYNENMELVDSVQHPFHIFPYEPVYGRGDRMYLQVQEESGKGVSIQYWDKTKIGTYHGKEYELTKVCEQSLSEGDLQEMEESGEEE